MQRLRSAFTLALAVLATWTITTATAQTGIPNYAYVRDSAGQDFVISGGQRIAVPIYPATDEQIAAIPWPGQWLGLKADGSGYENGQRPDWSTSAAAVPAPPSTSAAAVKLGADRGQNTAPFSLGAGNYIAAWRTDLRSGSSSCYTSATLYRVAGKSRVEAVYSTTLNSREGQPSASGETRVYGVTAGDHYLDVSETGCSWVVEIRPQ